MAANDIGPRIGIDGEAKFRASINAINAQMKSLGAEMKAVTAEFAANANSEEALTAKNDVLARSVDAARQKMSTLDAQLGRQKSKLADLAAELDKVTAEFGANSRRAAAAQNAYNRQYTAVANLERQYQTARTQLAGFENALNDVGDAAEDATRSLGAADVLVGTAGWDMVQTAVRGTNEALQDAIKTGMEFDTSVSGLAATLGTTVDNIVELRDYAKEMGAVTEFTARQSTEGLNYLALAGKNAKESMELLPVTMALASAGDIDLATSTDMATDAQSALRLSTEGTIRLVDEMALTATKTNTAVGQLGKGILTVGGTANYLSGGTRELNQILGVLADNSIKGEEGGTKLRNVILSLSSPTEKAAAQLDSLGVSVFDAEGNMRRFSEVFPELQSALSNLTSEEQITALSEIFNSRDIAAAQALLGTTVERWNELDVAIQGAAGSAQQMAETRLDNLAGDVTLLQSAADGAKIALSDSLTPALRNVTQAGTGLLTVFGSYINEFPVIGQALVGLTAGLGTLTVGMGAMTVASALGVTSIGALTSAILASPVAPFALAIGVGVTAFTALSAAADDAGEKITETARAIEESKNAYEEQIQAAAGERQNIEDLAAQLEDLSGKENRTAGEKAQLLAVTEQLNQAVPGLGLSYDQLNDTLSMTTEEVLALARAQADAEERAAAAQAVVDAERNHAQAVRELEQAQLDLAAAREAVTRAEAEGWASDFAGIETMSQLNDNVKQAEAVVSELEQAVADSADQIAEASGRLDELAESAGSGAEGLDGLSDAAEEAGDAAADAAPDLEALEEATLYAAGAADTLSAALKEQQESGSLSLDTTNKLIEAGYAAAISIDEETGAVTLNRDEYVRLASAKIQSQIATLEHNRAEVDAARQAALTEAAATDEANAFHKLAQEKLAATYADDVQALDLQIAALNRSMTALNSYSGTASTVARRSSSASKAVKTQAEKDLATYKQLKAELDHEKNMDLVDEAEYYRRLEDLRDSYLTDAANVDDYRKVSETIYNADQKALQEREKLWQTASDNIIKLEEDFQKELSSRASEIVNSYKLFDEVPEYQKAAGTELIQNLEDQINAIQGFYDNIAALEERGVDAALVEDIRSMGVKASGELEGLLELTNEQLSRYSELYGEKQDLANKIALEELGGLRAQTNEEILSQLDDVAELYDTNAPALGLAFANSLAEGMFEGMPAVEAMAQTVANAAMAAFESTYSRNLETMMTQSGNRGVTRDDIGELLAGAVNGINAGGGTAAGQPMNITLQTRDGIEIARAFLPDIRTADRESPLTLDDT